MPNAWQIIDQEGLPIPNGRIMANSFEEADKILFYRLCHNQCPIGCTIEEAIDIVKDTDILSIEDKL